MEYKREKLKAMELWRTAKNMEETGLVRSAELIDCGKEGLGVRFTLHNGIVDEVSFDRLG